MPTSAMRNWVHRARLTGDKMQQDVRNWLSPPDPWKNHNLARDSRHGGTGTWWIEGATYAEWKSSDAGSLLWVHGKRQYLALYSFPVTDDYYLCSGCRKERDLVRRSSNSS